MGGLVQGHPVTWRQSGLCPHTLACPCPLSLSPLLRAAQVSGPYRERRRHLRRVGPHSGLSTSLGSNLKGSQVLLCSHWKHSYLFIMLEKSLQDRKEMFQSTEFYFFLSVYLESLWLPTCLPAFSLFTCPVSTLHSLLQDDTFRISLPYPLPRLWTPLSP